VDAVRPSSALTRSLSGAWNYPSTPLRPLSAAPLPAPLAPLPARPPRFADPVLHALALAIVHERAAGHDTTAEVLAEHRFALLRQAAHAEALEQFHANVPSGALGPEDLGGGLTLDWSARQASVDGRRVFHQGEADGSARRLLFVLAGQLGRELSYAELLDRVWGRFAPVPGPDDWATVRRALARLRSFLRAAGGPVDGIQVSPGRGVCLLPSSRERSA
jgi:hypothetical protein